MVVLSPRGRGVGGGGTNFPFLAKDVFNINLLAKWKTLLLKDNNCKRNVTENTEYRIS